MVAETSDEARLIACEKLGVAAADAEFVVLSEPRSGLFGKVRGEARIRARVRPVDPVEMRPQGSRGRGASRRRGHRRSASSEDRVGNDAQEGSMAASRAEKGQPARSRPAAGAARRPVVGADAGDAPEKPSRRDDQQRKKVAGMGDVEVAEQEVVAVAQELLLGIAERFGLHATLTVEQKAPETMLISLAGDHLGLLIGARGATLAALQDLLRVAIIQKIGHVPDARIIVDIAGYRARRAEALAKFVRGLAETVLAQQRDQVLEPMSPADRKVVHDAIAGIAGLSTRSEGTEPSRRVVIYPLGGDAGEASEVS